MNGQQKYKPGLREEENHKDGLEAATKKAYFIKTKCLGKWKPNKWKKKCKVSQSSTSKEKTTMAKVNEIPPSKTWNKPGTHS